MAKREQHGQAPLSERTKMIVLRVTPQTRDGLRALAQQMRCSTQALLDAQIRKMIADYSKELADGRREDDSQS